MIIDDNYGIISVIFPLKPMLWVLIKIASFSIKTYVVGTHLNHLNEAIPISTHNIGFNGDLKNYLSITRLIFSSDTHLKVFFFLSCLSVTIPAVVPRTEARIFNCRVFSSSSLTTVSSG